MLVKLFIEPVRREQKGCLPVMHLNADHMNRIEQTSVTIKVFPVLAFAVSARFLAGKSRLLCIHAPHICTLSIERAA
jgi:hypothetical protein